MIVISPLIALMVDQVRNLRQSDVHAVIISSSSRDRSSVPMEFVASEKCLRTASILSESPEGSLGEPGGV